MTEGQHVKAFREKQEGQHIADWTELMRHPWGRRLVRHFKESVRYCGTDRSCYEAARKSDRAVDSMELAYLTGRADVGRVLYQTAQDVDFELFDRMLGEAANESRLFLAARRADREGET